MDEQGWWTFQRQGFLPLGRVLDDADLGRLQGRIDDIMLGRVRDDALLMQLDGGGAYDELPEQTLGFKGARLDYRKIQNLERDELFHEFMAHDRFRKICALAYGAHAGISCYRAMFMNKPAGQGTVLPWHQDGGGTWGLDRDPLVTVWTALDQSTVDNGCVEIIPGSHRLGLLSARGHTLGQDDVARHCPATCVQPMELKAGEAVLLHNWLIHRSGVNRTQRPRRGFSVCYMDARTRHLPDQLGFPTIFPGLSSIP